MIAVNLAVAPTWVNCGRCACVDGISPYPRWTLEGVMSDSRQCPRRLLTADSIAWLDAYQPYQAGHLLEAGGLLDQPAIYLAAMRIINGALSEAFKDGRRES